MREEDPNYPSHFHLRRIHKSGRLKIGGTFVHLRAVLGTELIGIEPTSEDTSQFWFGPIFLGLLTERTGRNYIISIHSPAPVV